MIPSYTRQDAYPHDPSSDTYWNESMYVLWYDDVAGAAGFHRLGYQPNRGIANYQCGISTREGVRFRRTRPRLELSGDERRATGYRIDDFVEVAYHDDGLTWTSKSDELDFEVTFTDFMPPYKAGDLWGSDEYPLLTKMFQHHYQLSGWVTGSVRIGERRLDLSCLGYRDHSWGVREWTLLGPYRCFTAQFGPDLSLSYNTFLGTDGKRFTFGHLYRDGEVSRIRRGDIVTHQEFDGIGVRGTVITFETATGARYRVELEALDNVLLEVDSHLAPFALGTARMAGRIGIGACETFNGGHAERPTYLPGAALTDGISRYVPFGTLTT
jgi:hypothetical protein